MLKDKNSAPAFGEILISSLKGTVFALLFSAALTVLVSAILYSTSDPGRLIPLAGKAVLFLSVAAGGIFTARLTSPDPAIAATAGFVSGSVFLLSVLGMSLIAREGGGDISSGLRTVLYLTLPPISSITAALSHKRPGRRRPHRRRR